MSLLGCELGGCLAGFIVHNTAYYYTYIPHLHNKSTLLYWMRANHIHDLLIDCDQQLLQCIITTHYLCMYKCIHNCSRGVIFNLVYRATYIKTLDGPSLSQLNVPSLVYVSGSAFCTKIRLPEQAMHSSPLNFTIGVLLLYRRKTF